MRDARCQFAKRPYARRLRKLRLRLVQLLRGLTIGRHVADDAHHRVVVAPHETRLEVPVFAADWQRVLERYRLPGRDGPLQKRFKCLREVRRQDIAQVFADETFGRHEERLRAGRVVVEIHAVETEDEHQIGDGAEDGGVTRFGALQGSLGPAPPLVLRQQRTDKPELRDEDRD